MALIQCSFKYGHLIEINAHSLFSKWFSESGKLVSKLFSQIEEYVEDKSLLVRNNTAIFLFSFQAMVFNQALLLRVDLHFDR